MGLGTAGHSHKRPQTIGWCPREVLLVTCCPLQRKALGGLLQRGCNILANIHVVPCPQGVWSWRGDPFVKSPITMQPGRCPHRLAEGLWSLSSLLLCRRAGVGEGAIIPKALCVLFPPSQNPSPPNSCLGSHVTSSEKPSLTPLALPPLCRLQ